MKRNIDGPRGAAMIVGGILTHGATQPVASEKELVPA